MFFVLAEVTCKEEDEIWFVVVDFVNLNNWQIRNMKQSKSSSSIINKNKLFATCLKFSYGWNEH